MDLGLKKWTKFVRYNRKFVITEFVLTEFHCISISFSSIAIIRQYAERRKKLALTEKSGTGDLPVKGLKVLEAFSASGLRSIRYAKEIVSLDDKSDRLIDEIVANDISRRAVERVQYNIDQNNVGDIVKANHAGKGSLS